jgi:hypothetical protein
VTATPVAAASTVGRVRERTPVGRPPSASTSWSAAVRRLGCVALLGVACTPEPATTQVGWLVGRWQDTTDPRVRTEERWQALPNGDLIGSGRVMVDGMLGFAETLAITATGDGLVYTAWPSGQDPVRFASTTIAPSEVVFSNPSHDFPREIRYARTAAGLQVFADGTKDGAPHQESWTLQPPGDPSATAPPAQPATPVEPATPAAPPSAAPPATP